MCMLAVVHGRSAEEVHRTRVNNQLGLALTHGIILVKEIFPTHKHKRHPFTQTVCRNCQKSLETTALGTRLANYACQEGMAPKGTQYETPEAEGKKRS